MELFYEAGELDALQRLYNRTTNLRRRVEQEQCIVESELIYKGLEYYRFIMECLPPASIPGLLSPPYYLLTPNL